mmetsp:Transcript_54913/g.176105  ORF Transcript_54913/g.176105 Transcript_54913/m.176105 type:complete len:251 (+) Transcript_54913:522-1274(+)
MPRWRRLRIGLCGQSWCRARAGCLRLLRDEVSRTTRAACSCSILHSGSKERTSSEHELVHAGPILLPQHLPQGRSHLLGIVPVDAAASVRADDAPGVSQAGRVQCCPPTSAERGPVGLQGFEAVRRRIRCPATQVRHRNADDAGQLHRHRQRLVALGCAPAEDLHVGAQHRPVAGQVGARHGLPGNPPGTAQTSEQGRLHAHRLLQGMPPAGAEAPAHVVGGGSAHGCHTAALPGELDGHVQYSCTLGAP